MLTMKADIAFTVPGKVFSGKDYPLRPPFNFGRDMLFSGSIYSDHDEYVCGQTYSVDVEFRTIYCDETFAMVRDLIRIGMNLDIQAGAKVIGKAKLIDFEYKASK